MSSREREDEARGKETRRTTVAALRAGECQSRKHLAGVHFSIGRRRPKVAEALEEVDGARADSRAVVGERAVETRCDGDGNQQRSNRRRGLDATNTTSMSLASEAPFQRLQTSFEHPPSTSLSVLSSGSTARQQRPPSQRPLPHLCQRPRRSQRGPRRPNCLVRWQGERRPRTRALTRGNARRGEERPSRLGNGCRVSGLPDDQGNTSNALAWMSPIRLSGVVPASVSRKRLREERE